MTKNQLLALKPGISEVRVVCWGSSYDRCRGVFLGLLRGDFTSRVALARVKLGSAVIVYPAHNIERVK